MKDAAVKEIEIPEGIDVNISGQAITAKHAGKEISRRFQIHSISLEKQGNKVIVKCKMPGKSANKFANTVVSHIKNIFTGLISGYEYRLQAVYSHFPMNISIKGDQVEIKNILGAKNPKKARIMPGCEVSVKEKEITVKGNNKEAVGQTAANIERTTRNTDRDQRRFQDGVYLVERKLANPGKR